jgi:6-phosphogluconolactonase
VRLDVYPTDAEAFEGAAAQIADVLREAPPARPLRIALSGGRGGRGVMVALAARGDLPWDRCEWFLADERCVPADDPRSNARLARESLFEPRGIPAARIHMPPVEAGDPERIAGAYGETVATATGGRFDLILLGMGPDGHIASLPPGARALHATTPCATVAPDEMNTEPHVARVTLTPPLLSGAAHVILTITGDDKAKAVAAALRDPVDPTRVPAALVRPSDRVAWIVDRAAAAELLRDAKPA